MKKLILIISLILIFIPLMAQPRWEIFTFVASFEGDPNPDISFKKEHTEHPVYPIMFKLPDKQDDSKLVDVSKYIDDYGNIPYFWNEEVTDAFLQKAINDFFLAMFKINISGTPEDVCDIRITFVKDPGNQESNYWVIPNNLSDTLNAAILRGKISQTLGSDFMDSLQDRSKCTAVMLMLPIVNLSSPHGWASLSGTQTVILYRHDVLNETTNVVAHEFSHMIYGFLDVGKGVPYIGKKYGQYIGATYSSAWPYDLMGRGSGMISQYHKYGIIPFHSNDLLNHYSNIFRPVNIEENLTNNKTSVILKSIREPITVPDLINGVSQAITIPITNDIPEDGELHGNYVSDQRFLIELRNGKGYDNISPLYRDGENSGILISHIINDKSYSRMIDIECATPFPPDSIRNPSLAWDEEIYEGIYTDYPTNGLWYFGKKVNDWMDDYAPNSVYTINGGLSAWHNAENSANAQALPEDLFNDSDRNAFTPATRPNTRSWKDNETNIAVFIDKIDGDYADLTIYRNYHSNPLTTSNAKTLPDGEKGLTIVGEGYIGESFSVGEGTRLSLGDGQLGQVTLIPNTNMLVKSTGHLMLREEGKLILENSSLNFIDGSVFSPYNDAHIELNNSNMNFQNGSLIDYGIPYISFYYYIIDISGASSFYKSEFEMKGASVLSLNEDSKFTLVSGTNFTIPAGANLIMNRNSELVVESGSNLIIDPNAIVQMGEGAKITIQNGVTLTLDGVTINGTDWAGINAEPGSTLYARYCTFTGAETAISGTPAKLSVSNCTFTDCTKGINLTACNDFRIIRNTFTGKGEGTAVTVTQSNGWINNNTASNFYKGLNVISCSPLMVQNTITNNVLNGVYTAGYNTYPQMYNPIHEATLKSTGENLGIDDRELNNTVYNNGINYVPPLGFINRASQLYMVSDSNIYLNEGMNNICSDGNVIPCIRTLGLINQIEIPIPILIYTPENYWGSDVNDSFFELSVPYYIDFSNYATVPYGSVPLTSTGPDNDQASKFLSKALEAELDGKYDKAIKTYEKIIEKYPDSSEAFVAYAKLPDSYTQESLSIEPLIEMYDMNIAIENSNKKFFKELKVSSHIKAKNYDTAIALSEEMKLEAGTEDEIILCDIDIAIANMLKNAENKGKGRNESTNTDISSLLDKLTGGEEKGELADITDAVMPETSRLYQNYPNPFNPVTQIKFDLAKTGNVKLSVYNINGQKVAELLNGVQNAGIHTVEFDGSMLNTGVYYYTLETGRNRLTNKMILTK